MPANTPKGYPYPLGTDRAMDGDDSIHNLATAVDTKAGVAASGIAASPVPGALNTPVSVAVTFPAGLFTATPNVTVTCVSGGPQNQACSAATVTATGATLWMTKIAGTLASVSMYWHAHQGV
jgi:hypothetical protein